MGVFHDQSIRNRPTQVICVYHQNYPIKLSAPRDLPTPALSCLCIYDRVTATGPSNIRSTAFETTMMTTAKSTATDATKKKPRNAPQLTFDDGSRAVMENRSEQPPNLPASSRDESIPIREYFEVDRLVQEIHHLKRTSLSACIVWNDRIALQFPDELLADAPDVCWEFEGSLPDTLVFTLGDTTYQSCCADQVAAAHLKADCIIHYGHACLSTCNMPVLYSFGVSNMSVDHATQGVLKEIHEHSVSKLVVLYEVKYHAQIVDLSQRLRNDAQLEVICGKIPKLARKMEPMLESTKDACGDSQCCRAVASQTQPVPIERNDEANYLTDSLPTFFCGGLELPSGLDRSKFTLLFVGEDSSLQFMDIVLRFLSTKSPPDNYWIWRPDEEQLRKEISPHFQRQLNRRFYMVQKARLAAVFGILVANLSDRQMRLVVLALDRMMKNNDRKSYIFAVGKINPAKLANFGEIDCFVLVACPEHSLLENDRDFPTPIITPAECSMALGVTEWGQLDYSLNAEDFLTYGVGQGEDSLDEYDEDEDAPYFNPVTGQYETSWVTRNNNKSDGDDMDLAALPGKGVLTTYRSAAADFLKQREYQGLQVQAGQTKVRVAAAGQQGIASNYNDR